MRALVVAPQPFFTPRGTPFSVYYRTLTAAELGVETDLLTYGEGRDVEIPGVALYRIPRLKFLEPVPVGPSWRKAVLDAILVVWTVAFLIRGRYDFVHAHEESVFFLRFLKPLFRFKLVYDMHSSLPQQLRNFDFTRSRVLIGAFRALEDTCLRHADAVITICPELEEYARPRMPDPGRHFLIENSRFEEVRVDDGGREAVAVGASPDVPRDRPIVVYAGTFEAYQGIGLLLRAFASVRSRLPDAFLLLVGGTREQVKTYRDLASELGLGDDVRFTGRVDPASAERYVQSATVLTSPRTKGTNTPLKIYRLLASGAPLVATRITSHTQVLGEEVCFLVEPDPESMADGIVAALEDTTRRDRVVRGATELYRNRYAPEAYRQKMQLLLEALR